MDILEQLREKFKLVLRNLEGGAREVATKNGIPRSDYKSKARCCEKDLTNPACSLLLHRQNCTVVIHPNVNNIIKQLNGRSHMVILIHENTKKSAKA